MNHIQQLESWPPLVEASRRWGIVVAPSKRPPFRFVVERRPTELAFELTFWTELQLGQVDRSSEYAILTGISKLPPKVARGLVSSGDAEELSLLMDAARAPMSDAMATGVLDGWTVFARDESATHVDTFKLRHPDPTQFPREVAFLRALVRFARSVVHASDAKWALDYIRDNSFYRS